MHPDELKSRVLYRDALMLIIDKPAGLPVHAGPGGGDTLDRRLGALRFGLPQPPALAHRLDRDTSGCLVLGRHLRATRRLGRLFADGDVEKVYWAVVVGEPPADTGSVELPLAKVSSKERGWRMVVDVDTGRPAHSDYRVLGRSDGLAWMEFRPRTGRTHQIRVHAAALGCPVLGDPVYGRPAGSPVRLHLHARAVSVPITPGRAPVAATAPVPPHMAEALGRLGFSGDAAPRDAGAS